jgi:hypothetical protein
LIVWHAVSTRPVVPSTVSYEDVQQGHDLYSAFGHGTHSHPTGTCTVRGRCLCSHQAERGLEGWYGAQRCTLDPRRDNQQAKDAERLEPKRALERVQGLRHTLAWTANATGEQSAPHPSRSTLWNVGSPLRSLRKKGREAVRPTNDEAGRGVGKSAGRPVMRRIRVARVVLATLPGAKARRLPCGVTA